MNSKQAERILRRVGFVLRRTRRHRVWQKGPTMITLPNDTAKPLYGFLNNRIRKLADGAIAPKNGRRAD